MNVETFYDRLPVLENFAEVTEPQNYTAVPEDWYVAVATIQDSVEAFEQGLYKAVNVVAVSGIAAVINALGKRIVPYVFAGDGAILCVPGTRTERVAWALAGTRRMARERFGLHLCVGLVPVQALLEQQQTVQVACYQLSETVEQNVFLGRGLHFAEAQVEQHPNGSYAIPTSMEGQADFSGLKCRWAHVPSRKDEIVVLLVKPTASSLSARARVYDDVIGTLQDLYGDRDDRRPVRHEQLRLTYSPFRRSVEHKLHTWSEGPVGRMSYWGHLGSEILRQILPIRTKRSKRQGRTDEPHATSPTDFETLEGRMREVMAGTTEQRSQIETYLREQYRQGRLIYGHSCSEAVMLTGLTFGGEKEHIHFVDGAEGGYARAARALRSRETALQRRQEGSTTD